MLLKINLSSSHVQNTFFLQTLWYGNWTQRWSEVKFPSTEGGSVNKENPQQTFLRPEKGIRSYLVKFYRMIDTVYAEYLTIIPRGRVGYEMVNSQRGA